MIWFGYTVETEYFEFKNTAYKHNFKTINAMVKTKRIKKGKWRTVESFWNAKGTAYFRAPADARIKVRYGVGWFGFDRQKKTLNGTDYKKLSVGAGSISRARMQIKVSNSADITYEVHGGGIQFKTPKVRF